MSPTPPHLLSHLWYPGHLAWVAAQRRLPGHDPGAAPPVRANLRGADLTGADLSDADLRGADLRGAHLTGAHLTGADLTDVDLSHANLSHANLSRANLSHANLSHANLACTSGIRVAGPVGVLGRMIYGVAHPGGPMIQAGCHWGTLQAAIKVVEARYADGTGREHLRADYLAALAWVGGCADIFRAAPLPPKRWRHRWEVSGGADTAGAQKEFPPCPSPLPSAP